MPGQVEDFAGELRELRMIFYKESQTTFAPRLGVSRVALSFLECGRAQPTAAQIQRLNELRKEFVKGATKGEKENGSTGTV